MSPESAIPRLFWLTILVGHGTIAGIAWWIMPGGFPFDHPRFWSNRVAPLLVLATTAVAITAARRHRPIVYRLALTAFPAAWVAAAIVGKLTYPISAGTWWLLPFLGACVMGAMFPRGAPRGSRPRLVQSVLVITGGLIFGASLTVTQRAPSPSTRPLNRPAPAIAHTTGAGSVDTVNLDKNLVVHGGDGSLTVRSGRLTLFVHPLLTFISRSPDRCWTLFSPLIEREAPALRLADLDRAPGRVSLRYRGDSNTNLAVERGAPGLVELESFTDLRTPVYSHLNSFCDIEVAGHRHLTISFSPCSDFRVKVNAFDYPVGRPARLAYLDEAGVFHVAEATTGEKGPFRDLARGRLGRLDALSMTIYDEGNARCRITWDDWAAQTSTALSPTAGWGLPVNAIEFSLSGPTPGSFASIFVTLAGTSVGRGWDSVGHSAGLYRNRMRIETLDPTGTDRPALASPKSL